jgi:ABC-type multidrug transport system fused ATPase/permease subunit
MVQQAIERLIQNRTSIVIAHRLSTIQNAHQIMVLDKGKVVEIGTPEQLLANPNGHYRKLYDTQFIRTAV